MREITTFELNSINKDVQESLDKMEKSLLDSLVGKTIKEAMVIINNEGYRCRIWGPTTIGTCDLRQDRINICHDKDSEIVTKAYLG